MGKEELAKEFRRIINVCIDNSYGYLTGNSNAADYCADYVIENIVSIESKGMNWKEVIKNRIDYFNGRHHSFEAKQLTWALEHIESLIPPSDFESPLSIEGESIHPKDFLPVLKENLEAMKHAKEMGWKDVLTNQDPFDCVIETYQDMIEIYKSRQDTRGDWTKCRCDNQFHWCFVHNKWGRVEGEREQEKRIKP